MSVVFNKIIPIKYVYRVSDYDEKNYMYRKYFNKINNWMENKRYIFQDRTSSLFRNYMYDWKVDKYCIYSGKVRVVISAIILYIMYLIIIYFPSILIKKILHFSLIRVFPKICYRNITHHYIKNFNIKINNMSTFPVKVFTTDFSKFEEIKSLPPITGTFKDYFIHDVRNDIPYITNTGNGNNSYDNWMEDSAERTTEYAIYCTTKFLLENFHDNILDVNNESLIHNYSVIVDLHRDCKRNCVKKMIDPKMYTMKQYKYLLNWLIYIHVREDNIISDIQNKIVRRNLIVDIRKKNPIDRNPLIYFTPNQLLIIYILSGDNNGLKWLLEKK